MLYKMFLVLKSILITALYIQTIKGLFHWLLQKQKNLKHSGLLREHKDFRHSIVNIMDIFFFVSFFVRYVES